MVIGTLVRALVFLGVMLFLILFDALLYFVYFLFFVVEIRIIRHQFSTLNSTLTMVRLMIPFVMRLKLPFFMLFSFLFHSCYSKL